MGSLVNQRTDNQFSPSKLLIHFMVGTIVFIVVALLATGLSFLVDYLSNKAVDQFLIYGLRFAEYLLFGVDLVLFVVFILRTGWKTLKEIWA